MRASRWCAALLIGSLCGAVGCSSESVPSGENGQGGGDERIGTSEQALTGGCGIGLTGLANLGLPCAPPGLQECEGVCAIAAGGLTGVTVQCVPLGTGASNDGKICGSSGSGDCTKHCAGKLCVGTAAPKGAACRPSGSWSANICDGQCDGAGKCVALTNTEKCPENATGDCTYEFCSAVRATTCVKYPLPKGIGCNDGSACTSSDVCDGSGVCGGTAKACPPSGSPCLVNACVPSSGACVASPAPGAACKFDACFAGVCDSTGTCAKGAAISCDDGNACTTDSCNATTGCVNTPIPGCGVDAGVDTGVVDTGPADTGVISDTGIKDTGVVADTGISDTGVVADTGISDTGVVADTGIRDTGVVADTGIRDTGVVADTGPKDTGVVPADTGAAADTATTLDSGSTGEDTATVDPDSGSESDSGATLDDSGLGGDDAEVDASADGASLDGSIDPGIEETVQPASCGCRTSSSNGSAPYATAALGLLALAVARRRR